MPVASTLRLDRSVDKMSTIVPPRTASKPGSPPRLGRTVEEVGEWPTGQVNWASSLRNPRWADPKAGTNDKYIGSNPHNPNVYGDAKTPGVRPGTASIRRALSPVNSRPASSRPASGAHGRRESTAIRTDADGRCAVARACGRLGLRLFLAFSLSVHRPLPQALLPAPRCVRPRHVRHAAAIHCRG